MLVEVLVSPLVVVESASALVPDSVCGLVLASVSVPVSVPVSVLASLLVLVLASVLEVKEGSE